MTGLKELLSQEQQRLEKIIDETKKRLKDAPTGTLRMSKSHNTLQYYRCTEKKKSGTYINKNNIEMAQQLAQKTYERNDIKYSGQIMSIFYW